KAPDVPRLLVANQWRSLGELSLQTLRWLSQAQISQGADREGHLCRCKTTTKRSQCRERDQLPHAWVHSECFHLALDVAPLGVVIARRGRLRWRHSLRVGGGSDFRQSLPLWTTKSSSEQRSI